MKDLRVSLAQFVAIPVFAVALAGCGGGASTSPAPLTPTPTSSTATLQGQWQIVAHSNVNPASSILVEANFSQSGSTVTADKSSVVLVEGVPGAFTGLSGVCDGGTLGDDSVAASISGQTVSYTLTEAGSLGNGTSTGSATISSDGTQITSGTYQTPAACGFAADSGSLTGTTISPFSGTFAGQLLNSVGTTDAVVVTVSQSGYTLNAVGTDAGAPISLTGKVVGATFDVTGVIQGQPREYVGIYDTKSNNLRIYDSSFDFLGALTGQSAAPSSAPISVSVTPQAASVATGHQQTFTATVANDSANKGVIWSLSCATPNGCGSLSTTTSASGTGVTYTAPATAPNPATATIVATSVSDGTKSASGMITIGSGVPAGISVTLSQTTATVAVNATTTFTATVTGDSSNQGVTWALSCTATNGCGSVSTTSSASGTAISYTAPTAVPSSTVRLTAIAVDDTSKAASAIITITPGATVPVVVGQGSDVQLNIVGDAPLVGWTSGGNTQLSSGATFQGILQDLEAGNALSAVVSQTLPTSTLLLNGTVIATEDSQHPPVISGADAAWVTNAGVFTSSNPTQPLYPVAAGDVLEVAATGTHFAYVVESGGCSVFVDGTDMYDDAAGCPQQLKFVVVSGVMYLGWCDGAGVTIKQSQDGTAWQSFYAFTGHQGVFGMDYAIRSDGSLVVAWTQYDVGEDGSAVWESDAGGTPTRLSNPVVAGFSGAGNPAVASDGSVAWLDDSHGTASGHFDVWLNGVDLSNVDDAIGEGPRLGLLSNGTRVVAWDDEVTVWMEEVAPD